MRGIFHRKTWPAAIAALLALLLVACGGAAATPVPAAPTTAPAAVQAPAAPAATTAAPAPADQAAAPAAPTAVPAEAPAAVQATATPIPEATPTPAPTATPLPSGVVSARDSITLVVPEEPVNLNSFLSIGASLNASVTRANLQDPLTWQSGDDLRIVPTSATTGWQQMDADTWRFTLRQGVKFHNGEDWNADASLPSFASQGNVVSEGGSINYTGPYEAVKVDDYTVDLNCANPCPIFPNTAFFLNFEAPDWLAATPEDEQAGVSIGFGPYQHVEWRPGVSITQEAYADYVPVGDHFEFQKPFIQNVEWQWRNEPTVIAAMIEAAEADIGWDIGVDQVDALPANMIRAGSSAETYSLQINTLWHPELRKKEVRQAMAYAVNCEEMVAALYGGFTTCRGNIIWPGIIGATEANTAPYPYDPDKARELLAQANYDPANTITLISRGVRVAKQTEISEAIHGYLTEIGMNFEFRIVEPSIRSARSRCVSGQAVQDVIAESGRDPETDDATPADMQAAIDRGSSSCEAFDLIGNQPSNETLDFGRQLRYYMNCESQRSGVCDPSPGGIQEQIGAALAAAGDERQQRLEVLADKFREEAYFLTLFDLPVIYAVNPKVNWTPRLDPNVRVSGIWFSE